MRRVLVLWRIALLVVVAVFDLPLTIAQGQDPLPSFEVASVKPTKTDSGDVMALFQPGRFIAKNYSLRGLILAAYGLQSFQLDEGPRWVQSERYNVEAKAEGNPPGSQMRLMLQSLLKDRFKLAVRTETRELPIYELLRAKDGGALGPQLKPSAGTNCDRPLATNAPPAPGQTSKPLCGVLNSSLGHWVGRGVPIEMLATNLGRVMGRVVLDRTGLSGSYDLDLQWTDVSVLLSPSSEIALSTPTSDGPSFTTALQEQLGLKVEAGRGPVSVLIIDYAEPPKEN
jgi:uncharacterized protein (TIGR03435 family)